MLTAPFFRQKNFVEKILPDGEFSHMILDTHLVALVLVHLILATFIFLSGQFRENRPPKVLTARKTRFFASTELQIDF